MPSQYYELKKKQRKKVIWKYQDLVKRIFGTSSAQQEANAYINNSNFGVQMMLTRIFNEWNQDSFNTKLGQTTIKAEAIPIIKSWIKTAKDFEIREVLLFLQYLSRDELTDPSDEESLSHDENISVSSEKNRPTSLSRRRSNLTITEVIERSAELRSETASRFSRASSEQSIISNASQATLKTSRNQKNTGSTGMRVRRRKKDLVSIDTIPNSRMSSRTSTRLSAVSGVSSFNKGNTSTLPELRGNAVKFLSPIETPMSEYSDLSKASERSNSCMDEDYEVISASQTSDDRVSSRVSSTTINNNNDSRESARGRTGENETEKDNMSMYDEREYSSEMHSADKKSYRQTSKEGIDETADGSESIWDENPNTVSSIEGEILYSQSREKIRSKGKKDEQQLPVVNIGSLFRTITPKKTATPYPK